MMNLPLPPKLTLHDLASPPAHVSPDVVTAQRSDRDDSAEQKNHRIIEQLESKKKVKN